MDLSYCPLLMVQSVSDSMHGAMDNAPVFCIAICLQTNMMQEKYNGNVMKCSTLECMNHGQKHDVLRTIAVPISICSMQ